MDKIHHQLAGSTYPILFGDKKVHKILTRNGQYLSDSFGDKKVHKIIPSNGCTNAILFAPKMSKVYKINNYHATNTKMLNRLIYCLKMGYKSRNKYKVEIHWLRWLISVDIVLILLSNTNWSMGWALSISSVPTLGP